MNRLTHSTKSADLFGTGKDGYTDGVPSVTPATVLASAAMNPLQEEVARVVEDAGRTLSASTYDQLSQTLISRMELSALCDLQARNWDSGGSDQLNAAAVNDDGSCIVLVGANGKIFTTSLGDVTLTSRAAAGGFTGTFNAVVWTGALFVAVGASGTIQTSPDGATWTSRTSGTGVTLNDLARNEAGQLIAVSNSGGVTLTSATGVTWVAGAVLNSGTYQANAIVHLTIGASSIWLLCGPNALITKNLYISTTGGSSWAAVDLTGVILSSDRVISVGAVSRANKKLFVAYVQATDNSAKVITSPDGTTWTLVYSAGDAITRRMGVGRASVALLQSGGWAFSQAKVSKDMAAFATLGLPKKEGTKLQLLQGTGFSLWCLCGSGSDNGKGQFSRALID